MAKPTNRIEFRETCLRRLGSPVIPIVLDDDQIEDIIDYALSYYHDYHYDGSYKTYLKHQLTEEDKTKGYMEISDDIIGVIAVLDTSALLTPGDYMFDARYQIMLNDMFSIASLPMINYVMSMRHLELINSMFKVAPQVRFNRHMNKIFLDLNWRSTPVGSYLVFECYCKTDPNSNPDVWADRWLLEYTVAQLKKQQGTHLKLYNISLQGGVTHNGQQIYNEAVATIDKLEEEMINKYSPILSDRIGPSF